ncbi:flagellar hook-associated protein FlgL [Simplicispira metamorpha]|uniref:Flagellar hook-associated protein 3 FlgL n=1 Tax=Simplicispira metamorpha TaxID=80881 RepID=A0A4R2N3I7_9BURK|nr:flagellar hook-associated protein FlgL [Simplicispira metamorpha]TCP14427.1 flagellar hook-associated protein 3 FlgL [Simplicispira metamorpha]
MSNTLYRLGTASQYDSALRNISQRQTDLSNLQENLTSGKRVVRASDDPVGAAQAERALTRLSRIQTEQRALDQQRNSIAQAESSLGDAVKLGQDIRELLVSAGNASQVPSDRRTTANQLQSLRDQLFTIASRKDTNGQPLFSALGSALSPLLGPQSATFDYQFNGLAGQAAAGEASIPLVLDGDAAFSFQPQRDGAYHAGISNAAVPPNPLNGRQLIASAVTAVNAADVQLDANGNGNTYQVVFKNAGPGASPNTSTVTYNIINTTTGVSSPDVVVPDFPNDKPLKIEISEATTPGAFVPGLKFSITATPTKAVDGTVTLSPANGDTITLEPSSSIFSVLDRAIAEIGSANNSNAAVQAVGQALGNLDKGLDRIHNVRGYAGELLNRADRITGDQSQRSIQLEDDRKRAEDLDMIQGFSDFQNQQVGYEAALKSYSMVQKLSLFNYIA